MLLTIGAVFLYANLTTLEPSDDGDGDGFGGSGNRKDTTPPTIVTTTPDDGEKDVDRDLVVKITFSEAMHQSDEVHEAISITPYDADTSNAKTNWISDTTVEITGIVIPDREFPNSDILLDPLKSTEYTISIKWTSLYDIEDKAGNCLEEYNWQFTTEKVPTEVDFEFTYEEEGELVNKGGIVFTDYYGVIEVTITNKEEMSGEFSVTATVWGSDGEEYIQTEKGTIYGDDTGVITIEIDVSDGYWDEFLFWVDVTPPKKTVYV